MNHEIHNAKAALVTADRDVLEIARDYANAQGENEALCSVDHLAGELEHKALHDGEALVPTEAEDILYDIASRARSAGYDYLLILEG